MLIKLLDMNVLDKINQIEQLKAKIDGFGEFEAEIKKKLDYKFRLDWNYYSNKMEGGTLTPSETRSVMVGNVDVQGKPLKDIMEMKNHDEAVLDVLKIVKGEQQFSEKRLRELHKAIMYEENPNKKKLIGEWKEEPNEVINYRDEKFLFIAPREVPNRIHELLDNTKAELEKWFSGKSDLHPIEIACDFHIEFLTIHPFYDGNGRIARILTNLILINCGYPPVIIREKKKYYRYLADVQCYGGDKSLLLAFLCDLMIQSQELVLKAIQGESIEDENDLDKRLALLDKQIQGVNDENEIKQEFSDDVFFGILNSWFGELLEELLPVLQKFDKYFINTWHKIQIRNLALLEKPNEYSAKEILKELEKQCSLSSYSIRLENSISIDVVYDTFRKGGLKRLICENRIEIQFSNYDYNVDISVFNKEKSAVITKNVAQKLYSIGLSDLEVKTIVNGIGNSVVEQMEWFLGKDE